MTLNNETINAAQVLASFDWPVFPVNPNTKAPLITGWQSRATCDRSGIIDLFKDYPSAAIGLVTGQKSGLVVLDIDERENFSGLQNFKNAGYEIAEMIIAHQVGSQVERAYNRTDYLEQRRHYMELWSVFVTSQAQT